MLKDRLFVFISLHQPYQLWYDLDTTKAFIEKNLTTKINRGIVTMNNQEQRQQKKKLGLLHVKDVMV